MNHHKSSYALNLLILYKLKKTKRIVRTNLKECCMQVLALFQTCQKYNLFQGKKFISSEVQFINKELNNTTMATPVQ